MKIRRRAPVHILTTVLGVVSVLDDHHVEELGEGVHYHAVNSIGMGCALDLGVDVRSLSRVEGIDDCIAMTLGTTVKRWHASSASPFSMILL